MKSLMGLSRSGNTEFEGMANRHTDMLALTNSINEFLVSASSEIPKLTDSHCVVILGLYRCRYSVGRVSIIGPRAHIYRFDIEHEPKTCVLDHYFIPTPGLHPRVPPPCLHVTRSLPISIYMGSTPNNPRPPDMGVHCYTTCPLLIKHILAIDEVTKVTFVTKIILLQPRKLKGHTKQEDHTREIMCY